jgi:hypothetical protein
MSDLYETDFVLWAKEQADLLRLRADGKLDNEAGLDWSNIAEEIDALAKSDRRELKSRVLTIMEHLIRLQASPATEPSGGWRRTIIEQRARLRSLLEDSPSLEREVAGAIADGLPTARALASVSLAEHGERPRVDPAEIVFTEEQVIGPWLP